jgi:hypothetical protein
MKLMKYNSNLLSSLVYLDSAKKFMAACRADIAIATAEKGLAIEDGRFLATVRAELQKIVEGQTTLQ